MFSIKLQPFLLLPALLFIFSASFSLSYEAPQHHGPRVYENDHGVGSRGIRWHLLEATNAEHEHNSTLILAAERTRRKDPLDGFNYYKGGWNIRERHYFSSVGFTAAPLFVLASTWFLGFGVCMLVIGLCHCCCQHQHSGYSHTAYSLSLIFLLLFTIASIVGCVVLYMGQEKFHDDTTNTLDYVVQQADSVVKSLGNVSYYLKAAKDVGIAQIVLPSKIQQSIDSVEQKINVSSTFLERETKKNADDIQRVLDYVRLTLVIVAAVMMLLAFLGFLLSVLGMRRLVYILVVIGWILVTVTFILGGTFLLLHNSVPPEAAPIFFNQSGPLVPILCNPFHSNITVRRCSDVEVNFNNAGQEWKKYICQVSETDICTSTGRLTPTYYDQLMAISGMASALYNYGPLLVDLGDCNFVRRTFRNISADHCPGLKRNSRAIVIGLVLVSCGVMISLIFWLFFVRERKHSGYRKHFESGSSEER
ncbi:hypothetical protein TIFTF001_019109 [Ficus carica]|uniref:Uncharacterized protein n=1 Tax=Ficus carica TaxID=3494 RepID=A0AA88APW7_FICCA|nr:hypothetical protein TIFTF001_019109 [Ficus carica]